MDNFWRNLRYDWPLHLVLLLTNWLPDNIIFMRLRGALARYFFGSCGRNLRLGRNVTFYNPVCIRLGKNIYVGYGCWFAGVEINVDDEVMFGPYVVLSAGNHTRVNGSFRYGPIEYLPINIGSGAWVGAHATILGGANIGDGSLVGSCACVTRGNIPDNSFVAGVPAVVKKMLK